MCIKHERNKGLEKFLKSIRQLNKPKLDKNYDWNCDPVDFAGIQRYTTDNGFNFKLHKILKTRIQKNLCKLLKMPRAIWILTSILFETGVAADRIAIQSKGRYTANLSPQNLISCCAKNRHGCNSGSIDRAWWFLRKRG